MGLPHVILSERENSVRDMELSGKGAMQDTTYLMSLMDTSFWPLIFCVHEACIACKTAQEGFNLFFSVSW